MTTVYLHIYQPTHVPLHLLNRLLLGTIYHIILFYFLQVRESRSERQATTRVHVARRPSFKAITENSQTVTFADTNNNRNNNIVLAVGDLSCEGICEGNDLRCTKIKLFSSTCYTPTTFPFPSFWLQTRSYTP